MASPIANSSFAVLALLLVISSLFFTPSSAFTKGDIKIFCSKAQDPSFCYSILTKAGGLPTFTFKDLANFTIVNINLDSTRTTEILNTIGQFPGEKVPLEHCFQYHSQVQQEMVSAKSSLAKGDRTQIRLSASKSAILAEKCHTELRPFTYPFNALIPVTRELKNFCNILELLSDKI